MTRENGFISRYTVELETDSQSPVCAAQSLAAIIDEEESIASPCTSSEMSHCKKPTTGQTTIGPPFTRQTGSKNMTETATASDVMWGSLPQLQKSIHEWAITKEWRGQAATPRPPETDLGLFVSEVAEALECLRDSGDPNYTWETYTVEVSGVKFANMELHQLQVLLNCDSIEETLDAIDELGLHAKPEGFGPELGDLMIRILDTAEEYGIDMSAEIARKMIYNYNREIRHGGKRF